MATATQENQAEAAPERGVRLTDAAVGRVREFLDRDGGAGLRIDVRRTGCSGWAYDVELASEIGDSDHVFEQDGLKVLVSDKAMPMVAGTTVDFVQEGLVREFRFRNPNVTGECGCGESFTVGQ
ncbi:MAG: iron-sulfur cluster assembly accessory protein [Gammaproteobacteria bacterium]|jgi:iron-sulfur cluster assembly protein|nr:iron-sulfur cluster assembly accessory protein [Gammaproteobacteria bacterium]NBD95389.1 iron-sulfur cluster assembly accessory protein [Gammaproteobacteria bacterium]